MIFEQILSLICNKENKSNLKIKIFKSVPEIINFYQGLYPDALIQKSLEGSSELGIQIIQKEGNSTFLPIRESQKSGYYLIEVP